MERGYRHEYRYAHDELIAYAAGEAYRPDSVEEPGWYEPVPRGLEIKVGENPATAEEVERRSWEKINLLDN